MELRVQRMLGLTQDYVINGQTGEVTLAEV